MIESDIRIVSRQQPLVDIVNGLSTDPDASSAALQSIVNQRNLYDELLVLRNDGSTFVQLDPGDTTTRAVLPEQPSRATRDYFQQTMQAPQSSVYVSAIDLRDLDGNLTADRTPSLRLSIPLFTDQSERWGMLLLGINLSGFLQNFEMNGAANRGELWLLDQNGYWLASPTEEDKWGQFLPGRESATLAARFPQFAASAQQSQLGNQHSEDGGLFSYTHICADLTCQFLANQPLLANLDRDEFAPQQYWTIASYIPASELSALNVLLPEYERWIVIALSLIALIIPSTYIVWKLATSMVDLRTKEIALHDSMRMHEAFFERNPTVMFVKSLNGKYLMANASCREFAGSSESMIGQSRHAIFPSADAAVMDEQDAQVLEYKQPMEFNSKLKRKTGYQYFSTLRFPMLDDDGNVLGIGGISNDITDQVQARMALRESETQFRTLLETAPVAVILTDTRGRISLVNKRAEEIFGYDRRTLASKRLNELLPDLDLSQLESLDLEKLDQWDFQKVSASVVNQLQHTGSLVEVSLSANATERGIAITCLVQDVSDRAQLEAQLRQSQKMEAIGKLTGGMAHDFNNLLGVIIGNLDLATRKLDPDGSGYQRLITAKRAAERGAELTKRMLAVARRQSLQPKPTDINRMIVELTEILPRTLGPDIEMICNLAEDLPPVLIDHSGLENVLINLALNSRDAMPKGGKFIISTDVRALTTQVIDSTQEDMKPGDYVHITVTDTGEGMDANTLSRAFEPFFTTKERGKGTGLGLAMIYGFAKQSGGNVKMMSSPGAGTTMELWLPAAPGLVVDRPAPAETRESGLRFTSADEVLVVDDEAELLEVAVYFLQDMGCTVLSALNAEQALQLITVNDSIKLLLTDIVMPGGMNGVELAAKARALNPDIRVLYTSGFPEGVLADKSGLRLDAPLLQKPYTIAALGAAISLALQSSAEYRVSPGVKS